MKRFITMLSSIIAFAGLTFMSCDSNSTADGKWTQEERKQYMKDCVSSALATYQERGEEGDIEVINNICECAGTKIESKYSYNDAAKIPAVDLQTIMAEAANECGPKK